MQKKFDWSSWQLCYPLLKKHIAIRVNRGHFVVSNCRTGDSERENKENAVFLLLCNGGRTLEEILRIYRGILDISLSLAKEQAEKVSAKYAKEVGYYRKKQRERDIFLPDMEKEAAWKYSPLRDAYPYRMTIALTRCCNHRCDYCFNSSGNRGEQEVGVEKWIRVITQAHDMGIQEITFTGGEPFLYGNFIKLAAFCSERGIYPKISTNGTFLDESMIRKLKRAGAEYIHLSLPAVTEAVYDRITGSRGDLPKVKQAVRLLKQYHFYVRVKMVLTPHNLGEVSKLLAFCAETGVDFVHLAPYVLTENSRSGRSLLLGEEELLKVRSAAEAGRKKYAGMEISGIPAACGRWKSARDITKCGGIKDSLTILANGRITFCEALGELDEFTLGNIQENSLEEIWNSDKPDHITNPEGRNLDKACRECEYADRCRTGCFVFSHMQSGNPWSMDPRCFRFAGACNIFDGK